MEPNDQNPIQTQPPQPDTLFAPSVPGQPPAPAPSPSVAPPMETPPEDFASGPDPDAAKRKKIIVIAAAVLGTIFLALIIFVLISSGGKKPEQSATDQGDQSTSDILTLPSALDIENADNSISSDITGLNDDNDFPAANLADENLQL